MTQPAVTIYLADWCPYCQRAKALLLSKSIALQEINVEDDPKHRELMRERSAGRNTIPQIFIGDRHIGGCDDLLELDRRGELDRLLQGA